MACSSSASAGDTLVSSRSNPEVGTSVSFESSEIEAGIGRWSVTSSSITLGAGSLGRSPTGSAAEVTPVGVIDEHRFSVGEITKLMIDDYDKAVGKRPAADAA